MKVINQAIINSGVPVNINYENNATFGLQQQNYMALRLDYLASKKLTLGGTIVRLGERPFFIKQNYGDDPIRNTMYGLDFDYRNEMPRLTSLLDKLPFYSTKAMSSITAYGEAAVLKSGHAKQIGKGEDGVIYIDDFEGTRTVLIFGFHLSAGRWLQHRKTHRIQTEILCSLKRHCIIILLTDITVQNLPGIISNRYCRKQEIKITLCGILKDELSKPETRQVYST